MAELQGEESESIMGNPRASVLMEVKRAAVGRSARRLDLPQTAAEPTL
ncbi:hypothetical protein LZ009_22370 [Ramlibacter sp. XY19]|nr:hypothetical protein [Ramlibacter paludis]MCG2595533.1 hypothetical protein [Ramlibacter paludis]